MDRSMSCASMEQDLVLYLYDELPATRRADIENHAGACGRCHEGLESFRTTLRLIDRARIGDVALPPVRDEWPALRARLLLDSASRGRAVMGKSMLKAAAVLLLAGSTFAVGRYWEEISSFIMAGGATTAGIRPTASPADSDARMKQFAKQTGGYLTRSRLVLLEFANSDASAESSVLQDVSRSLLREGRRARQLASDMADPQIENLVAQLERILGEVSHLPTASDNVSRDRVRQMVNESGLLEQLEVIDAASHPRVAGQANI